MSFTHKLGQKIQRAGGMVCEIKGLGYTYVGVLASDGKSYNIKSDIWWKYYDIKQSGDFTRKMGQRLKHKPSGSEYVIKYVSDVCEGIVIRKDGTGQADYFENEPGRLMHYVNVPTFFQVGKTYKFKERNGYQRPDTWKILDLYEVDNPAYGVGKYKAISRMTTEDDFQDIQTLSQHDFDRMVEV